MTDYASLLHYGTAGLTIGLTALGVGIGQGIASSAAIKATNVQPSARNAISQGAILGLALIETAALIGLFMAGIIVAHTGTVEFPQALAESGIVWAIGLPGFAVGILSGLPVQAASFAIARQPFSAQRITRFMLITQSLIQTPLLFALIIAFFIKKQSMAAVITPDSLRILSSGIAIGLGALGPVVGLSYFASVACKSISVNPKIYPKIISFTLISESIVETPIIFAFIVANLLLFRMGPITDPDSIKGIASLAAALAIGIGTTGAGVSSGVLASSACHQIALYPELHMVLSRLSIFGQALIESCVIYAALISFGLIFFH